MFLHFGVDLALWGCFLWKTASEQFSQVIITPINALVPLPTHSALRIISMDLFAPQSILLLAWRYKIVRVHKFWKLSSRLQGADLSSNTHKVPPLYMRVSLVSVPMFLSSSNLNILFPKMQHVDTQHHGYSRGFANSTHLIMEFVANTDQQVLDTVTLVHPPIRKKEKRLGATTTWSLWRWIIMQSDWPGH